MSKVAVIFGGSGFIGSFYAVHLIESGFRKVYIADIDSPQDKEFPFRRRLIDENKYKIEYVYVDVRKSIDISIGESVDLIANFAAVHREPGHEDREYFETNILGANNVTEWASKIGCKNIIFTSSISPYGISEEIKDESTLPVPVTAYGSSKLVAEKIHIAWRNEEKEARTLTIVRPGVVFGPGEGGNVTRLVRAVIGNYFFYMGNKDTRKAGIYVKELCNSIKWVFDYQKKNGIGLIVFNGTMNPGPSISEYVGAVCNVSGLKRNVLNIPYPLLYCASVAIDFIAKIFSLKHPFSPVRVKKLIRSNNIIPGKLVELGYDFSYDLDSAMRDWKNSFPEEWEN